MIIKYGYRGVQKKVIHYPSIEFESPEEMNLYVQIMSEVANRGMYDYHPKAEQNFARLQMAAFDKWREL